MRFAKKTTLAAAVVAVLLGIAPTAAEAATPGQNGGPVGPGLSDLPGVSIAESILEGLGIVQTYAELLDLDAGLVGNIIGSLLGVTGKEGVIGIPGSLLGSGPGGNK